MRMIFLFSLIPVTNKNLVVRQRPGAWPGEPLWGRGGPRHLRALRGCLQVVTALRLLLVRRLL
jgi:hypothetical protein